MKPVKLPGTYWKVGNMNDCPIITKKFENAEAMRVAIKDLQPFDDRAVNCLKGRCAVFNAHSGRCSFKESIEL